MTQPQYTSRSSPRTRGDDESSDEALPSDGYPPTNNDVVDTSRVVEVGILLFEISCRHIIDFSFRISDSGRLLNGREERLRENLLQIHLFPQ